MPSPSRSCITATPRSRRFGRRSFSAAASARSISSIGALFSPAGSCETNARFQQNLSLQHRPWTSGAGRERPLWIGQTDGESREHSRRSATLHLLLKPAERSRSNIRKIALVRRACGLAVGCHASQPSGSCARAMPTAMPNAISAMPIAGRLRARGLPGARPYQAPAK